MNEFLRTVLNLPEQASSVAYEIDLLHYFVISVTMLGSVAVALACLAFVIRYRRETGRGTDPKPDTRATRTVSGMPLWIELGVIAGLLTLFTGWWVIGYRQYNRLQEPPPGALDVYVIGKQWMWSFAYPGGAVSNAELYVPVGQPVRLNLSSRDVIHSFYVPDFRIKQDVVPGRMTTAWFEATKVGTYEILCAEYCGTSHSTMLGEVVVLSQDDWARRLAALPTTNLVAEEDPVASLAEMGKEIAAQKGCLRCHTVDGTAHIGPSWAETYGSRILLANGQRITATPDYLTQSMMDPLAKIRAGFAPIMPSYQGQLSAGEAGAIVEYIRSLRGGIEPDARDPLAPTTEQPVELPRAGQAGEEAP